MVERHHDGERAENARDQVAKWISGRHRRPVRLADEIGKAAHRFSDAAKARAIFVWAGLTESRDMQKNDPRIDCSNHVRPNVPLLEGAGAVVFHDHVRAFDQLFKNFCAFRLPQIEGDAALIARHRFPPKWDTVHNRLQLALAVAVFWMLDLDHVRAEVGKQYRCEWRRDHVAGIDDTHAFKWFVRASLGQREIVVFLNVIAHRAAASSLPLNLPAYYTQIAAEIN